MSNGDQGDQSGVNERSRSALIIGAAVGVVFVILLLSVWVASFLVGPTRTIFLVVAGILALVALAAPLVIVFKTMHANQPPTADDDVPAIRAALVVVGTIVVVFGLLALGAWAMKVLGLNDDAVRLPLLVIAGLVSLIALLAVMAIAFKTVSLANQTQALGLPEGTVRAVIALSLILIFAVVTVYLFSDLSCGEKQAIDEAQTSTATDTAVKATNTAAAVAPPVAPTTPPVITATDATSKAVDAAKTAADAATKAAEAASKATPLSPVDTRRASKLAASQDFAKQLLIMLGTLITSITSFYFASKTGTDTTSLPTTSTPPKLAGVDTPSIVSASLPAKVTAQGSGLQLVQLVTLRNSAKVEVGATDVFSNDTTVQFTVPKGTVVEKWDVTVKTSDGSEATLPGAITIT